MKYLLGLLILTLSLRSYSQKESLYVFDRNWNQTDVKTAVYILQLLEFSDTEFRWSYYNMFGPMIKFQTTRTRDAEVLNGKAGFYDSKGILDSVGQYKEGLMDGDWLYCDDSGRYNMIKTYESGKLVKQRELRIRKHDDAPEPGEKESDFQGGSASWVAFLNRNLKYPERAINLNMMGEVRISFSIDEEGKAGEPYISKSVEYSLDTEGMRIIRITPKWTPAQKDGVVVKSFKVQPIIFKLEE